MTTELASGSDRRRASTPIVQRLADFEGRGYNKQRSSLTQALWFTAMNVVFIKWWCPSRLRVALLRAFGAEIGDGVLIRHHVRVLWPWKLTIGANAWIGEGVWILNLEDVHIGHDTCISQEVSLVTGSHDMASPTFEFDNGSIMVGDRAWIAFGATILRGSRVGNGAVVGAHCLVRGNVEDSCIMTSPGAIPHSSRRTSPR